MADYLVLEEDGTSHLELEESGDDFLLETSSPHIQAGAGVAGTSGGQPAVPVAPSADTWKVGTITVPSGTGNQAITGLGGKPKAIFFFGTNWLTEDASITTRGSGLFRGMCAPQWDAPGTLLQNALVLQQAGDGQYEQNNAIYMVDQSGGWVVRYQADVTALNADGFTLNWLTVTAGGYKVVYVALMNATHVGAYIGTSSTLTLGWKAGACLLHGSLNGPVSAFNNLCGGWYGGGAYPGSSGAGWYGAGVSAQTFPSAFGGQFNIGIHNDQPGVRIADDGTFAGPFFAANLVTAQPTGGSLTDFSFSTNLADNAGMVVAWDDDHSQTGRLTPGAAEDDTATVSGLPFAPALLLGYTIGSEPHAQGNGARGAIGFSVVTPEFQWTAFVLDHAVGYPAAYGYTEYVGAFQSFQRGVADSVQNANVHAGTIELTDDGFIVTTQEDDIAPQQWVWHAFGGILPVVWLPQEYRRN